MGLGKQVRITRPPEKFRKYLDKKAQVISLIPIAQHPLQYKVKVDNKILTLPIDALEPCKIDRDEGGEGLTRYLTVNDLMYCPDHEMEVCGSCGEDHRYTNFIHEYTEDDALDRVESWMEGMQRIGAPPRRAPVMRGRKKEAPGNPAVFHPVISEHLVMIEDEFNPSELSLWPEGKSMETALRNVTAFSFEVVPEAFKLPVRRLRETIVVLGRNFDSYLATKDPNEPMARYFLQDAAQTQALTIDLLLPVRQMEVNGIVFPVFAVRWANAKATDSFERKTMIMKTMERNTKMCNIPVETDEIDLMAAFLEENARHLDKQFVRSNGKKHMSVSLITPISDDMQTAHHGAISHCGQCGTSGCDLMECARCRKISYCSRVCQKKNWPYHKKTCGGGTTKAAPSAGRSKMPTASGENYPHELFSKALRKYAHPAAIADLDALERGGKSWERFLEAFGTNCRDAIPFLSQQQTQQNVEKTYHNVSSACPLRKALIATCGQQVTLLLTDYVYDKVLSQIRTFGRPLESKTEMLRAHEIRLNHNMAERQRHRQHDMHVFRNTSSSVRKDVSLHQTSTDWSSLTQVFVRDLKLYDSHESMYIEGKLLIEPFTPMVGTTTILEDSKGDVILIALYNFLPEGLFGPESVPVASAKIPKGATVRIAAPFMKVFRDGSRGLRIDNPNEISVISSGKTNAASEKRLLLEAKIAGNQLVKAHKYLSASEAYIGGLRSAEVIPTILSNRSQAYAMIGDWERSFADAAASLTIRPGNKKTWSRYETAREKLSVDDDLGDDFRFDSISLISTLLPNLVFRAAAQAADADSNGKDLMQLKNDGNNAFKNRKYEEAAKLYTAALVTFGETERALLSNWALCCLSSQAHLDVVAAAAASLRIRPEAKAVIRLATAILLLGEAETCNEIIGQTDIFDNNLRAEEMALEIAEEARSSMPLLQRFDSFTSQELGSPKYLPRWIGKIETFDAGSKGRGVRAISDLKAGEIVLLEPPLASASRDSAEKAKESLYTINKLRIEDASQTFLCQAILLRSQREAVLSRVVDCLFDGTNARPLTSLDDLIPSLNSSPPLLPTHYEYCPGVAKVEFNSDRIGAIVSTNSHGSGSNFEFKKGSDSALYPAVSMFNHSPTPNCDLDVSGAGDCAKVIVKNDVKAGEELFVCYHQDENVVRRNWLM